MNPFDVILTPEAQADILRLDPPVQIRVLDKLEWIAENVRLLRHQPLRGEEWQGFFKYRLGDYRLIYQLDWSTQQLTVLKVGHRRDVYE